MSNRMKVKKTHKLMVYECYLNTRQMNAISFSYVLFWYSNGCSSTWDIAHRV